MEHTRTVHDDWRLAPDEQFKMIQVKRNTWTTSDPVDVIVTSVTAYTGKGGNTNWSVHGIRLLKSGTPGKKTWTGYIGEASPAELLNQIPDEIRAKIQLDGLELPRAKS